MTPHRELAHRRSSDDPTCLRGNANGRPIGGYLEPEDLVFILDVNSDYQPWLVERTRLFDAINTLDGDKKRGLLLIE
jgi:hypothetical protein